MLSAPTLDRIAQELKISADQVARAVALLDGGNTVPFIARYRKDTTGGLDEAQLEAVEQRNHYFTALEQRRAAVVANIEKQGKLTDALREAILSCMDKAQLEDLYLPFKRKRSTRAALARTRGLEPLAEFIRSEPAGDLDSAALRHVDAARGVATAAEAIEGARDILAEEIAEDAAVRARLRARMTGEGVLRVHSTKASDGQKTTYDAFYGFSGRLSKLPAHRLLAILRGDREGALRIELGLDDAAVKAEIVGRYANDTATACAAILRDAAQDAYDRLLRPAIESEVLHEARQRADESAIRGFRQNVKSLLLAPVAGRIVVMGFDPAQSARCRLAVVNAAGDLIGFAAVDTAEPGDRPDGRAVFQDLVRRLKVCGIAVGNGAGSREATAFVRACVEALEEPRPFVTLVSESGAMSYAASKIARDELPDLDSSLRGAVSIARRLQDPLAELVKIEPRSIGVGQYQHDVNQKRLREGMHRTVTECVNRVGADVNAASVSLLRYIAGIQYGTAQNIVEIRRQLGGFNSREQLQQVPGIGPKVYQQCAGFLRVRDGDNPLDATGVHPEAYETVAKIAESAGVSVAELIGNAELVQKINAEAFVTEEAGPAAIADILHQLAHPGRDPRKTFTPIRLDDRVRSVQDLETGMLLQGMVTNVTDFGAFVDVGAGHDGLVHLSELTHRFVSDPRQVVRVGDGVQVKVIAVDKDAPRLSFSMKAVQPKRPARRKPRKAESDPAREKPVESRRARARPDDGPRRRDKPRGPGRAPASDRKKRRERPARPVADHKRDAAQEAPLNTQLADQLAELRDRLKTG